MNRNQKTIFFSIGISLLLHGLFFVSSTHMDIKAIYTPVVQSKKLFRIKSLKTTLPARKVQAKEKETYVEMLRFQSPLSNSGLTIASIDAQIDVEQKTELHKPVAKVKEPAVISKRKEIDLIEEDRKNYKDLMPKAKRKTREALVKIAEQPDMDITAGSDEVFDAGDEEGDFFDKMPGFTPQLKTAISESVSKGDETAKGKGTIKRKRRLGNLKRFFDSVLFTYEDLEDGQKYYKISIKVGDDGVRLATIPKEIIFLVDCSLSTQRERLDEFKKGIKYSLNRLNPQDTFNILAFKKTTDKFRSSSVEPTDENVQEALKFVENLTSGEKTDTYNALYKSIADEEIKSPSYIILLSDGHPTRGVTDSRKLINDISALNNGQVSIFTFSGGLSVNRYLLDFIAYKNRGWSEYSYRSHFIGRNLSSMYEKIKDPLLLKLKYHVSGLNDDNIFPKILPDLFRNTEFTLYGKYTDEQDFAWQILGEGDNKVNEFIIKGSFEESMGGDESIARNWAFNKIYHLISLLESDENNEALIQEIIGLSKKFKIKTPYGGSLRR